MDLKVSNWVFETFGSNEVFLKIARFLTLIGDTFTIIAIIALLLAFNKTRKLGVYAMITVLFAALINNFVLKLIIERERPFVANSDFLKAIELSGHGVPNGYSMPSGHSISTMAFAVCVFLFNKKIGIASICLSILCGMTRIILCVHYLTDVLVGFALGIAIAILVHYLINLIIKKYLKRMENQNENNSSRNQQ